MRSELSANLEFYSRFDAIDIPFALWTIAADRRSRAKGWGLKVRVTILAIALFCVAAVAVFFTAASPGVLVSVMLLIGASVAIIRHGKAVYQTSLQTSPLRGGWWRGSCCRRIWDAILAKVVMRFCLAS